MATATHIGEAAQVSEDLGPLAWVLDELRKSLDSATKALRRFVRDAELARGSDLAEVDASQLRIARQQLHQAVGALEMVGLGAPAKLLRAMEALAQKFIQRPELCSEDAATKVERASFALAEYLEGVLKGRTASSVALFPQYRDVLDLIGGERVHPADLWSQAWRWREVPGAGQEHPVAYDPAVRGRMDQAVLKMVKTADTPSAASLRDICLGFAAAQTALEPRTFWKISAAYFEAMALGLCPADVYSKRAASRVLTQYATLAKGDPSVSDRLAQDLLFFCAQAAPHDPATAPVLTAVRAAYGLTQPQPVDYETPRFGQIDPAQLAQARKRIASATETWSALAGGDVNRLKAAADQFEAVAESVLKLHPESGDLARALTRAVETTVRSGEPPAAPLAMEVATAVLYLDAAYEDLDPTDTTQAARSARLAQRLEHVGSGGQPEPLESWMEELYRRVSDRQTMGSVVDELRTTLGSIEKALDQFFRNPNDKMPLHQVPGQLAQMRGVFSVLGLDQASTASLRMRDSVEKFLVDEVHEDNARAGVFDKLGSSLGAMGFLIDMLGYQRAMAKRLFVYDEELGEFKPTMGREKVVAEEPVPDEALSLAMPLDMVEVAAAEPVTATAPLPVAPPASVAAPVPPPVELDDDEAELRDIFLDEAREVVQTGLQALRALAAAPSDLGEQTTLRRAFHTLKGSARMVGLTEFGEAGWSFEQLLNTWLADQKPVGDEMVGLCSEAMHAFGRWAEDIAVGTDANWSAPPFRKAADAMRSQQQRLPLEVPGAEAVAPVVAEEAALAFVMPEEELLLTAIEPEAAPAIEPPVAIADMAEEEPALEEASAATELQTLMLELPNTQAESIAAAEFADAQADLATHVPTPEQELAELDSLEAALSEAAAPADFAATQLAPSLEPGVARTDHDFQATQLVSLDTVLAPSSQTPEPVSSLLDELDFGDLVLPTAETTVEAVPAIEPEMDVELEAEAEAEAEAVSLDPVIELVFPPESTPVAEAEVASVAVEDEVVPVLEKDAEAEQEPIDEQTKVIGALHINLPLYNVYLNEADEWSRRLLTELSEWALELHQPVPDAAVALAHSLSGSSATVGFMPLSDLARLLEQTLQHVQLHGQGLPEHAAVFNDAAEDIRRLLHQFAAGFLREPDPQVVAALQDILAFEFAAAPVEEDSVNFDFLDLPDLSPEPVVQPEALINTAVEADPEPEAEGDAPALHRVAPAVAAALAAAAVAAAALPLATHAAVPLKLGSEDDIDAEDALDADLFPIFEEEATELLPQLGGALRQWAARPDNLGARSEALRVLHTLKGSARLAGAMYLGEMAHRMESAIERLGSENVASDAVEPLLAQFDSLGERFHQLRLAPEQERSLPEIGKADAEVSAPVASVEGVVAAAAAPLLASTAIKALVQPKQLSNQTVRVRSQLLDQLLNQAGEVMITRSRLDARLGQLRASLGDLTGNLDRLRQQLRDIEVQAESQMQSRLALAKDTAQGFDPLEFDRFTRVQELTRMMAESVNDVATVQRNLQRTIEGTEDDLIAQARQARELQHDLLRTRMVEFEGISERLYGVVRQASKDAGKQVKLDITGGSMDMDRGVLDRMAPAFEHLLRNAVAHGIESAPERVAAGKPAAGTIQIEVHQESNAVSVSFSDDGAGLDLKRIRAKAIANGVVAADAALSEDEAANLIFMPGFSTAEAVTELSGRGIGLDVVRSEVNALGGRIETTSEFGKGTQFKLVLPLTTAVTQVVMLRLGELAVGVPANVVETIRRVPEAELADAYASHSFSYAGETMPFYWSGALLQASARSLEPTSKHQAVAVFRSAGRRVAAHVDEVLGNQEVVVKNLGPQLARLPGLTGMSVLASGAVALIYNPVALAAVYGEQARQWAERAVSGGADGGAGDALAAAGPALVPLVLVVDDSITVRRVTQRLLKREGYRVALAADGLQALERLKEERPTVVLSDIEMPRMDGFDLARNIRADAELRDLPIIMITSRIAEKHREHARELGVDHYLGKPYPEDELLGLVKHYCTLGVGV